MIRMAFSTARSACERRYRAEALLGGPPVVQHLEWNADLSRVTGAIEGAKGG